MKNKLTFIMLIITIVFSLVACGNKIEENKKVDEHKVIKFEIDNNTVKVDDMPEKEEIKTTDDNNSNDNDYKADKEIEKHKHVIKPGDTEISELVLKNDDTSKNYVIDNGNIIYDEKIFYNLYNAVNNITSPYDSNTLLNFIIKTYGGNSKEIRCYVINDRQQSVEEEGDVGSDITLDESLNEFEQYKALKEKYNDVVYWLLIIMDSDGKVRGDLYGCDSYIIYKGSNDKIVDMSEFISEVQNNEEQSNEEVEDNNEESE